LVGKWIGFRRLYHWNCLKGWKYGKICQKSNHTCNHSHIYGINMKKPIQNFFNFHYETMVHSIEFMVSYTKCEEFSYKTNGWKVCSKLVGFSKFPTYFYMRTLINYDYDMNFLKTYWSIHISALSIWKFKKSNYNYTFIILSYTWNRNVTHTFIYLK
jgi:hypothetical protein